MTAAPERLGWEEVPGVLAHPDPQVTPNILFLQATTGADDSHGE